MIDSLSYFGVFLLVITLFIAYAIYKLIVWPYLTIQSYKKKGALTYFYPIQGFYHQLDESAVKYGDVFGHIKESIANNIDQKYVISNVKSKLAVILHDPEYVKEVLQHPHIYVKSDIIAVLSCIAPRGMVFSEGDSWKAQRKFISKSFHYEFIKSKIGMIQDTTKEFLDKLKSPEDLMDFRVIPKIQEITGETVGRIFFGERFSDYTLDGKPLTLALYLLLQEGGHLSMSPEALFLGPKVLGNKKLPFYKYQAFFERKDKYHATIRQIIQERRQQAVQDDDMLGAILNSQKDLDTKDIFTDENLIYVFTDFFAAGMDTTGHLVAMTLYNLKQNPKYFQELKEEINHYYNTEAELTDESLKKMDSLHSHLKESLRLQPPFPYPFLRESTVDHKVLDLEIKKGTQILINYCAMMWNPKHFENPLAYVPERWRNPNMHLDPYAFTPFSAGPRNCIGQHMAMIEAKIIVSEFLSRFEYKLKENYELKMTMGFLYEPKDELMFDLTPRKLV